MSTNAAVHYTYALVVTFVGAAPDYLITAVKEMVLLTGETRSANTLEVDEGSPLFGACVPPGNDSASIRRGCLDRSVGLHVRMREHQQE
jgi:hypothetical protein